MPDGISSTLMMIGICTTVFTISYTFKSTSYLSVCYFTLSKQYARLN